MIKIKKLLILILLLCIVPIINVNGEEVCYSDYSEWSPWQEEEVIQDDFTLVEKEKRYRWHKKERVYSNHYYLESYNDGVFPYIDWDDYISGEYSEYSREMPHSVPGRLIRRKPEYEYRNMKPIRYVYLMNSRNGYYHFKISEVNVWVNDVKINYNYYCAGCSDNFKHSINDGNIFQDDVYIRSGSEFRIDLGGYYNAAEVRLDLYLYDPILSHKTYEIIFSGYSNLGQPQAFYKAVDEEFYCNSIDEVKKFEYTVDSSWLKEPEWFEWETSDELIEESLTTEVNPIMLFSYSDLYYRRYQIVNNYYDINYYKDAPDYDYIKDEEDYVYYYRFKIKELLDIDNSEEETEPGDNVDTGGELDYTEEDMPDNENTDIEDGGIDPSDNVDTGEDLDYSEEGILDNDNSENESVVEEPDVNEDNNVAIENELETSENKNIENDLDFNESENSKVTLPEDNRDGRVIKREGNNLIVVSGPAPKNKAKVNQQEEATELLNNNDDITDIVDNEKEEIIEVNEIVTINPSKEEKKSKVRINKANIVSAKPLLYILSLVVIAMLLLVKKYYNRIL
ncbi:MAG: hypothetical protein PHS45_00870 [Bacilli bacterium]|nr:hypothetical protein [Bacilli bacterium]